MKRLLFSLFLILTLPLQAIAFPPLPGVSGPSSSTNGYSVCFDGTTGKLLKECSPQPTGDVESVGDCTSGACLDGSSDGGTYISLYDGNSNWSKFAAGNSSANLTWTFPTAYPAGTYLMQSTTGGAFSFLDPATFQSAHAILTALAGLTIADVSIIEGTGANAFNVVTSGGANRVLGANSDNSALEFKSTLAVTSIADDIFWVGHTVATKTATFDLETNLDANDDVIIKIPDHGGDVTWTMTSAEYDNVFLAIQTFGIGAAVKNGATGAGFLEFYEDSDNGIAKITLKGDDDVGAANFTLTLPKADDTLVAKATSDVFTNKTFDAAGTGNILKQTKYITLSHPHARGAGVTSGFDGTETNAYYGQALFSNSSDQATNFIEYRITVPEDLDTAVDLSLTRWKFRLSGADTGTHRYVISMVSVADSAAYSGTVGNAINLDFAGDGSGADGDVETVSSATLTDWKSNLTAGQLWVIRVARDGDADQDASTVDSYSGPLVISYGSTQ